MRSYSNIVNFYTTAHGPGAHMGVLYLLWEDYWCIVCTLGPSTQAYTRISNSQNTPISTTTHRTRRPSRTHLPEAPWARAYLALVAPASHHPPQAHKGQTSKHTAHACSTYQGGGPATAHGGGHPSGLGGRSRGLKRAHRYTCGMGQTSKVAELYRMSHFSRRFFVKIDSLTPTRGAGVRGVG